MDIYNTFVGALVIGAILLIGSGVVFALTRGEALLRAARQRAGTRRMLMSGVGIALFLAACIGLGRFSFEHAFDRTQAFIPANEVRWEPVGELPTTSFDRFDYGSASNAELARRS
ncbi:MAG: hypothetical protein JRH16_22965 [Deltaproteobacteria bacterium]|nr:hypothetical protein [Deltaproteobacteria bacterium]